MIAYCHNTVEVNTREKRVLWNNISKKSNCHMCLVNNFRIGVIKIFKT